MGLKNVCIYNIYIFTFFTGQGVLFQQYLFRDRLVQLLLTKDV